MPVEFAPLPVRKQALASGKQRFGARHRHLDQSKLAPLVESMRELGLLQPITVYTPDDGMTVELVAGRHRLEAARILGWDDIPAIFMDGRDEIDRELIEIAENLHRVDLTREERDRQIRRYADLLKLREAVSRGRILAQNEPVLPRGPGQPRGIATKIAEQTGLSKATVNRVLNPKPKPIQPPREPALDKHGDPDMRVVAHRLARKHTVGELQDLIDHLMDIIKERLAA